MKEYKVRRANVRPELKGLWDGPVWGNAEPLDVACFHRESSTHHPETQAKLLYDDFGVYGIFQVHDQYVQCVSTEFQDPVWQDSCVEFFVWPEGADGYFNFEMNAGGALLLHYNKVAFPIGDDSRKLLLPLEDGSAVGIYHSLPSVVDPECQEKTTWVLEFAIPFSLLSKHAGEIAPVDGTCWRANLYKCADGCSHPHWASWAPQGEALNFHQEQYFGTIRFAD